MIRVTCAIIEKEGKILLARRSEKMPLPLQWEFPGGKLEPGEDPATCIQREILEELGLEISVGVRLDSSIHESREISIELIPFVCSILRGEIHLAEHKEVEWVLPEEAKTFQLAQADIPVLANYILYLQK